jgi:hypothetical protein
MCAHGVLPDNWTAVAEQICSKPDMPLMYVNMGFCRITGYSLAEVLYKNCRFLQVRSSVHFFVG